MNSTFILDHSFNAIVPVQYQWCQPAHPQDPPAPPSASDQQRCVCASQQGLPQHDEAGGALHCLGVSQ